MAKPTTAQHKVLTKAIETGQPVYSGGGIRIDVIERCQLAGWLDSNRRITETGLRAAGRKDLADAAVQARHEAAITAEYERAAALGSRHGYFGEHFHAFYAAVDNADTTMVERYGKDWENHTETHEYRSLVVSGYQDALDCEMYAEYRDREPVTEPAAAPAVTIDPDADPLTIEPAREQPTDDAPAAPALQLRPETQARLDELAYMSCCGRPYAEHPKGDPTMLGTCAGPHAGTEMTLHWNGRAYVCTQCARDAYHAAQEGTGDAPEPLLHKSDRVVRRAEPDGPVGVVVAVFSATDARSDDGARVRVASVSFSGLEPIRVRARDLAHAPAGPRPEGTRDSEAAATYRFETEGPDGTWTAADAGGTDFVGGTDARSLAEQATHAAEQFRAATGTEARVRCTIAVPAGSGASAVAGPVPAGTGGSAGWDQLPPAARILLAQVWAAGSLERVGRSRIAAALVAAGWLTGDVLHAGGEIGGPRVRLEPAGPVGVAWAAEVYNGAGWELADWGDRRLPADAGAGALQALADALADARQEGGEVRVRVAADGGGTAEARPAAREGDSSGAATHAQEGGDHHAA